MFFPPPTSCLSSLLHPYAHRVLCASTSALKLRGCCRETCDDGDLSRRAEANLPPAVSAEVSSERSPRRRSISGLGSSEKSVAVDNPSSSPFKVPVRNRWLSRGSLCLKSTHASQRVEKTVFLLYPKWCILN